MAHLCVIAVWHGYKGDILDISITAINDQVTINFCTLVICPFFHYYLCFSHSLHGMCRVYPPTSRTVAVGDIQFECQSASFRLGCRKSQVMPPVRAEGVFSSLCRGIIGMLLVVIDHPTETSLLESFYVGSDTFVCGTLVTKEPPCLHAVVYRWIMPQTLYLPIERTVALLCADNCQHS